MLKLGIFKNPLVNALQSQAYRHPDYIAVQFADDAVKQSTFGLLL